MILYVIKYYYVFYNISFISYIISNPQLYYISFSTPRNARILIWFVNAYFENSA